MFKKNTPLKVVLLIFITEIIILVGLGIFLQMNISKIHTEIDTEEIISLDEVDLEIEKLSKNIDVVLIVASIVFVTIAIVLSIYMSKI